MLRREISCFIFLFACFCLLISTSVYAQNEFEFYESAEFYSINLDNEKILVNRSEKIYRRYTENDQYEYKTESGFFVEKQNDVYVYSGITLYTIDDKKIVTEFVLSENGNIESERYMTEDGEEVIQFIEYGINGDKNIRYRTYNTSQPTYSIYVSNSLQQEELINNISGTEVTIPYCDLPPMSTIDMHDDPDKYEFKCWRFEAGNELRFYYPGDTIVIPNRDITLYAIFVEKGTESAIPDTHNIIFKSNDKSNSVIENIGIYTGNPVEMPDSLFTRDGYTFSHWTDGTNNYNPGDTYVMPDHDVTLTAVWIKDKSDETPTTPPQINWSPIINQIINSKPAKPDSGAAQPTTPTYTCPYTDISGHWAEDIIEYIDELGLIDGITSTEFKPDEPMTREMFVTAVARLAGVEENYIGWAIENGILLGYGNGEYGLGDTVTREQMAVFFLRFFDKVGIDIDEFRIIEPYKFADDVSISDWASDAVYEIQSLGLIKGKGENLFDPKGTSTRAQAATVIYNLIQTVVSKVN